MFSVGDKVVVLGFKPNFGMVDGNYEFDWDQESMERYVGRDARITEVLDDDAYDIDIDNGEFGWLGCWLKKID